MRKLSEKQWSVIEPYLPRQDFSRGGRPRVDNRQVFEAIRWVLTTGAQWNEVPVKYGSGKTAWRKFTEWKKQGIWKNIWQQLLVILDREEKLTWEVAYLDGTFASAKKRGAKVGKTRRGKGTKIMLAVDGTGIPLTFITEGANISEFRLALPTIDSIAVHRRPQHPKKHPNVLVADRGYDAQWLRKELRKRTITPKIPKRRKAGEVEQPSYNKKLTDYYKTRWIVERTNAWLQNYRRIAIRWDRYPDSYEAFIELACILICLKRVLR